MKTIYTPPPPRDQRNANIDCLKAICACFVVCIHVPPFGLKGDNSVFLCAVPCFYMISGYLIYNKDAEKFQQRLLKNLKKILKITLWASLLYFAYSVVHCIHYHEQIINLSQVKNWIILNKFPFGGNCWYLYAYIYVLIIHYFLSRWKLTTYVKYAVPILLIIFILFGQYSIVIFHKKYGISLVLNWLFDGLPFFTIGMLIKGNINTIRTKITRPIIPLVVFTLVTIIEMIILKYFYPNSFGPAYISTPFYATVLFITFLLISNQTETWVSRIGRELSLYIYVFHGIVVIVMLILMEKISSELLNKIYTFSGTFLVLLATLLFSYLFIKVRDKIFNKISLMHLQHSPKS